MASPTLRFNNARSAEKLQVPPPHLEETTMRRRSMTIGLAVALLAPQYALTWNGRGHMMVAAVAHSFNKTVSVPIGVTLRDVAHGCAKSVHRYE